MKRPRIELPLRIALLYLLFGGLWILLSDQLLFLLVPQDAIVTTYQTLKGWFFILISGVLLYLLLRMDIAGRRRAEQRIRSLASFPEQNPNPIVEIDPTGAVLYMNPAAQNRFPDLRGQGFEHPWLAGLETAIAGFQHEGISELQREVQIGDAWFSQLIHYVPEDGRVRIYGVEITERKQAEQQTLQLKRMYATLSQVNQTIVRVKSQQELFETICKVAVEFGEFAIAWFGLLDEASGELRPVASTGEEMKDWTLPILNIHHDEYAQGLPVRAIRTARVVTSEDIQVDAETKKRYAELAKRGYPSLASVPVQLGGKTIGVLSLLSREVGLFKGEQETNLLEKLGLDISFALDMMQKEAERKQSQDALQLANARFLHMIDANIVGISIADASGKILLANDYYLDVLGVTRKDLLEGKVDWRKFTPPEWLPADEKAIQELRERGVCEPYEKEYVRADGTRVAVYIADAMLPGPDEQIIAIVLDITARKQAEEALREKEERLRLSLQAANQGLYDLNVQTGNAVVNRQYAEMLGYDPETFVETNAAWIERLHPDDREITAKAYSDYISGLLPEYRVEFRQRTKDGHWKWILSLGEVIEYDSEGKPLRMLGTHTDITERKRAEEEIQSRSRQLAALLDASQSLTESLNLAEVWQKITEKAADVLQIENTAIYLVEGEHLYLGASTPPLPPEFPEAFRRAMLADHPHIAQALDTEQPVILPDTTAAVLTTAEKIISEALKLRTIVYIPLVARKVPVGILVLGIAGEPRDFSMDERDVARAFSHQAELAIANAKLYEDLSLHVKELENQIVERKRAQERFHLVVESAPNAIILVSRDGKLRMVNAQAENYFGYDRAEMIGMDIEQLVPNRFRNSHVVQRMDFLAKPHPRPMGMGRDLYGLRKDGTEFPAEIGLAPLESPDESLVMVTIVDITVRRQAEEKLRRHISYLTGLREVDQAIASSFDVRLSLSIIASRAVPLLNVDAAAILLLDPIMNSLEYAAAHGFQRNILHTGRIRLGESYAGRAVMERRMIRIPNLANDLHNQFHNQFLKDEKILSYCGIPLIVKGKVVGVMEIFHRTFVERDQEWFDFLDSLAGQAAIAIDNARLWEQVQRHARDLERRVAERTAALNRTNAELEQANRAKDEFLANMSHELRTPLNSILGLTESLLEQRRDSLTEYQQKSLEIISSSGRHLLELINDILDLSKIEAGKFDHYPQVIEVDALCRSSLAFVKSQAVRKSITLTHNNETSVSSVSADPRRLKQILVNLLTNAVKFTPERGEVILQVRTDVERELIQFSVIDSGIGIAPQDLKRLFQPFVQVDSRLNRQFEGTGLGLALVQKLTDLHGGSVEVESEIGVGSRFTVNLPWKPEGERLEEIIEAGSELASSERLQQSLVPAEARSGRGVVLLAEDNIANILTIAEYLESHGYSVVKAHDGLEAIEKAEVDDPNLILMDIQMPVMDGMEAIRRLRANPRFAATPIIAITALAMPGDRERCLETGANEYMSKPLSLKMLMKTILNLTEQQT